MSATRGPNSISAGEAIPAPSASFDGGNLDCGSGLLLLIRRHIDRLNLGELLEIFSTEPSVREDLASWCRLTANNLVSVTVQNERARFLVSKGPQAVPSQSVRGESATRVAMPSHQEIAPVLRLDALPKPSSAPEILPFSVMGVGSWPRPRWLLRTLHEFLTGRLDDIEFQETADDSVRLVVAAQHRARVDVLTDGEQRRDDYASFVGERLDNCQLIPITDLLPYVEQPDQFAASLRQLDVPADKLRFPAVFGPLSRHRPLAVHEFQFVRQLSSLPVKIALPGPYLLTRTMWMECIADRAYATREELACDVVRILREELHCLLAAGVALVQFDEPVLTEVVHGQSGSHDRSFMCGAIGRRRDPEAELDFAAELMESLVSGSPASRVALHICRGNWTPDVTKALTGDYHPLLPYLKRVPVGTLFLEYCTPRAGDIELLEKIPATKRIGVGTVDQKSTRIETCDEILSQVERVIRLVGPERIILNPDCGFATFADSPITPMETAERKLRVLADAADILRHRYHV